MKILSTSDDDILNEYVFRHFNSIFNGQIKNIVNSISKSTVKAEFKNGSKIDIIDFFKEKCSCAQNDPIIHKAYYINNPFVIDRLNEIPSYLSPDGLETNVIAAIKDAQNKIDRDKMTNIINVVSNMESCYKIFQKVRLLWLIWNTNTKCSRKKIIRRTIMAIRNKGGVKLPIVILLTFVK